MKDPNMKLKKGDVVTFTYDHFTLQGVPVNPVLVRVRTDVSWEDVVIQSSQEMVASKPVNNKGIWSCIVVYGSYLFNLKRGNGWVLENGQRQKYEALFWEFCQSKGFRSTTKLYLVQHPTKLFYRYGGNQFPCPLNNGFNINDYNAQTGRLILRYFEGDFVRALRYLFPEVSFDDNKFQHLASMQYKWQIQKILTSPRGALERS